ncbi:ABC transporter ATP-binding protein [Dactylosporangium sp. CA-092794]|uniref:ABC transporter ATP-binding protein n=1 Tax=Dactylosporangium sp. CA-092794 TaxID=3239929 RepID=UPI003D8EACA7
MTRTAPVPVVRDTNSETVLEVENLSCSIDTDDGPVKLVDNVSFAIRRGETLGVVGESGSGKTMLVRTIMGINPSAATVTGRVMLDGVDVLTLPKKERRRRLGAGIGMVFQNPMTSLNPVVPVGRQITEGLRYHRRIGSREARARALELLGLVGISEPAARLKQYPHQLSGGMRQRVMIAAALACDPDVLIADEATTALDVTVQKQILDLVKEIQTSRNMSAIIISHDLGVVAGRTDQLAVMYSSQVVETGPTAELFRHNRHQYTSALLRSIPDIEAEIHTKLATIPGSPRRNTRDVVGCRFAPRCRAATDKCHTTEPAPEFNEGSATHWYRCFWPTPLPDDSTGTPLAKAGR